MKCVINKTRCFRLSSWTTFAIGPTKKICCSVHLDRDAIEFFFETIDFLCDFEFGPKAKVVQFESTPFNTLRLLMYS